MIKKLRQNRKNKKGFTLVELIVVIVIILILAAVLVPSVLRYVERARQANCQSEAAAVLVELQAELADAYATATTEEPVLPDKIAGKDISSLDTQPTFTANSAVDGDVDGNYFVVNADNPATGDRIGDLTRFIYSDGTYTTYWTRDNGWVDAPYKVVANP